MEIILPFEHPLVIFISYLMSKIAREYPNVSKYDSKEIAIDFFFLSTFAIIEEMATGKLLIQDGKEISLLKSGAVEKRKKNSQGL